MEFIRIYMEIANMEIPRHLLEVGRNLLETSINAHGNREELIMEFLGISIRKSCGI